MQGKRSHGTLVADVENHIVVGRQTVVQPLNLCRRSLLGMGYHQVFAIGMNREIETVEIGSCRIGHFQCSLIPTIDIAEVGAVSVGISPFQQIAGCCTRLGNHQGKHQHHLHSANTARQAEGEPAALSLLAFGVDLADGEESAHLPVFVDDALAIEQSETMTARIGAIEDMRQSCFVHSLARIGDGNLNVTILGSCHLAILGSSHLGLIHHLGANHHLSAAWCKLTGVIGDGIDHEERKGAVGLHHGICRAHLQVYAPHLETHLSFGHNVEERLQREALDAEADGALAHLNPIGEHAVVLVNLVGQL